MKWTNKGHQFDYVYENIKKIRSLYIFGAGEYGKEIFELLHKQIEIKGFIDNDEKKREKDYMGMKVYSLDQVTLEEETGIIVTVSPATRLPVMKQLNGLGYLENEKVFTMEVFMSVYTVYETGKVYIPSVSYLPSTRCNLKCETCLNFTPYMKTFVERSWEQVTTDVDQFFSCVDYIMLFHISGGEPMLYPDMGRLVEYIDTKYRDKIKILRTVTNGTVIPKKELLEKLSKHHVKVTVDDYREAVKGSEKTFAKLLTLFDEYNVEYDINKVDTWIDLAPFSTDRHDWEERQLQKQFEACYIPWQELRDGKLYSCNYASYAFVAGIAEEEYPDEVFDLNSYTKEQAKELVEFRLGYNTKGYVEFCKRCSGFVDVNPYKVMPAKQVGN